MAQLTAASGAPVFEATQAAGSGADDIILSWNLLGTNSHTRQSDNTKINIRYSPDNGQNWQMLAVGLSDLSFNLNKTQLPASSNGLIELIATNSTESATKRLEIGAVANKVPFVAINGITQTIHLYEGEPLVLEGIATDMEDGALSGNSLAWRDSQNGQLGNGTSLILPNGLGASDHTITLTATDKNGATTTVQAKVTVEAVATNGSVYLPIIVK